MQFLPGLGCGLLKGSDFLDKNIPSFGPGHDLGCFREFHEGSFCGCDEFLCLEQPITTCPSIAHGYGHLPNRRAQSVAAMMASSTAIKSPYAAGTAHPFGGDEWELAADSRN